MIVKTVCETDGSFYSTTRDSTRGEGEAGCVTQGDLVAAVASTQPSVTGAEVAKYEAIYARFRSGKSAHQNDIQQRATLA